MRVKERTYPAKFNLDLSTENDWNMMPPFPLLYPSLMHQNNAGNAGEQSSPLGVTEDIGCTPKMVKFSIGIMMIKNGILGYHGIHRM